MSRLRWSCVLIACSPLLGCPQSGTQAPASAPPASDPTPVAGGQVQQQQQTPTSQPASRPAGHPGGSTAPETPAGPPLLFSLNPKRTVAPRIDVSLERLAILPMTAKNIEAEPIDLSGLFQPTRDAFYVAIVLRVTVDGKPWTEIDDGTGVEKIGPFALELPDQIVNISGTALSD